MTNKEKYKQAFSVLHTSENFSPEAEIMAKLNKKKKIRGIIAAAVAVLTVGGFGTTAYAANLGNIQRQIQIWVQGDQTSATLDVDETKGTYSVTYTNEAGEEKSFSGGGMTIDVNGKERPVNEAEIMEHIDVPEVEYFSDGSIKVFYHAQEIDITDKFDKDDFCFVQVSEGEKTFFMTILKNGGYGIDTTKFPSKKEVKH